MFSYEYNRFGSGKKDLLIGLSFNYHKFNYVFRNTKEKRTEKHDSGTLGFINLDLTERFKGFSLYQNFEFSGSGILKSGNNNENHTVRSVLLRFGVQKDFLWVISDKALTFYTGGALCFRGDKTDKSDYKNTILGGLGVKIGCYYPLFNHSQNEALVFLHYQGDLYVLQNATSNGNFKVSLKDSCASHTVSFGININIKNLTNNINEKRVRRHMEKIEGHNRR